MNDVVKSEVTIFNANERVVAKLKRLFRNEALEAKDEFDWLTTSLGEHTVQITLYALNDLNDSGYYGKDFGPHIQLLATCEVSGNDDHEKLRDSMLTLIEDQSNLLYVIDSTVVDEETVKPGFMDGIPEDYRTISLWRGNDKIDSVMPRDPVFEMYEKAFQLSSDVSSETSFVPVDKFFE